MDMSEGMTIKDAMRVLGVSDKTLRRWIGNGKVRFTQVGREYHLYRDDIRKIAEEQSSKRRQEWGDPDVLRVRLQQTEERLDALEGKVAYYATIEEDLDRLKRNYEELEKVTMQHVSFTHEKTGLWELGGDGELKYPPLRTLFPRKPFVEGEDAYILQGSQRSVPVSAEFAHSFSEMVTPVSPGFAKAMEELDTCIPAGSVPFVDFFIEHGIPETSARRAVRTGVITVHTGRWKHKGKNIMMVLALEEQSKFIAHFENAKTFKSCPNCPH